MDPIATGNGFDQLEFSISRTGVSTEDDTFTDLPTAMSFFKDNVLDYGAIGAGGNTLDLDFSLTLTSSHAGDSFSADFLIGNAGDETGAPLSLGAGHLGAAPEPGTLVLLAAAAGTLLAWAMARRRRGISA